MRIVIVGGPRVGKTTLSKRLRSEFRIPTLRSADDIRHLAWSEASQEASHWFSESSDWIFEGVQMARALRKWLAANPNTRLDADLLMLNKPFVQLLPGQAAMTAGVRTVFSEIQRELVRRGARIHALNHPDDAFSILRNESRENVSNQTVIQSKSIEEAERHMNASYANEKSITADTLVYYGGELKALGNGRIAGYAIIFGGADLQNDIFTKETNCFVRDGDQRPILYRHGSHPLIKSRQLGVGTLTKDDVGWFFEGELELRDKYDKAIYRLVELNKVGISTGSMGHLVQKLEKNKSFEITDWPIGEISITPTPVEPRTAVIPIKSLPAVDTDELNLDQFAKEADQQEYAAQFCLDGIPSIKSFCEAVAPNSLKDGSHRSESAANAAKEFITISKFLGEAYDSYATRLVKRTESRFLKQGREIDPSTVMQVASTLSDMERVMTAFDSIKESLLGIKKISDMGAAEQRAMNERARAEMMNFCRIRGLKPEEFENAGTSTS